MQQEINNLIPENAGNLNEREAVLPEVLVISDDGRNAQYLESYLNRSGIRVAGISMDELEGKPVLNQADLIVLHLFSQEADPVRSLAVIKGIASAPVIAVTSRVHFDRAVEGLGSGLDDVLCTPFYAFEVVLRIQAVLRRRNHRFSLFVLNEMNKEVICS